MAFLFQRFVIADPVSLTVDQGTGAATGTTTIGKLKFHSKFHH